MNPLTVYTEEGTMYIAWFNIKLCILSTQSIWGPRWGTWETGPSTGNFERWMKGALGMGPLSLKRLTAEGLEGWLFYWVPWVMKGRLWGRASLSVGAQVGNLEWACLTGDRDG
jgi:hypothetical protein